MCVCCAVAFGRNFKIPEEASAYRCLAFDEERHELWVSSKDKLLVFDLNGTAVRTVTGPFSSVAHARVQARWDIAAKCEFWAKLVLFQHVGACCPQDERLRRCHTQTQ